MELIFLLAILVPILDEAREAFVVNYGRTIFEAPTLQTDCPQSGKGMGSGQTPEGIVQPFKGLSSGALQGSEPASSEANFRIFTVKVGLDSA